MRLLLAAITSACAAFALSYYFTVPANPEVAFWAEAVARRVAAVDAIREKNSGQPIIFFAGGSSTAFSIDPVIIEEITGYPTINLGLPVASGARYILHQALREANSGDIVIIGTEPDLLTNPGQEASPSKLGFALEARRGSIHEAAGGSTFDRHVTIPDYLKLSRPGVQYLITLTGRTFTGKGYRYKIPDIRPGGLIHTPIRDLSIRPQNPRGITQLHPEGQALLETFVAMAKKKNVRVAYSLPWSFSAADTVEKNRENNRELLENINVIIPVIEDGYSGAMEHLDNFSDAPRHLSAAGSAARSRAIAISLNEWIKSR